MIINIITIALLVCLGSLSIYGTAMVFIKILDIKNTVLSTVLSFIWLSFCLSVMIAIIYFV